jgi:uncharacterized membrane protein (TIGR02234 family)
LRGLSLVVVLALGALAILAWSQQWFLVRLSGTEFPVGGDVSGGAVFPLALVSLALVAALALAGAVFRVILGVLEAFIGVGVIASTAFALSDPVTAMAPALSKRLGISGPESLHAVVTGTVASAWPAIAIVAGALMVIAGLAIAVTSRAWPISGRKYSATRAARAEPGGAVQDWDALSDGEDPTSRDN